MNINNLSTVKKQSGVILVVALVILLVLTLLVVSSMNTTNTQVLMTGNTQFHTQALNDAESALRFAESVIEQSIASGTPIAAGFYNLKDPSVIKPDITNLTTWSTQAASYTAGTRSSLYVIEYIDFTVLPGESISSSESIAGSKVHLYRIPPEVTRGVVQREFYNQFIFQRHSQYYKINQYGVFKGMKKMSRKSIIGFLTFMSVSLFIGAAAVLSPTTVPYATIASYTVSDTNLQSTNQVYAYQPWFENGAWQGDIIQHDVSATGGLTTTINLTTNPPTNSLGANPNWSARLQFDAKPASYYLASLAGRKIITTTGATSLTLATSQTAFQWGNLTPNQQTALGQTEVLDFIRGDRQFEFNGSPGQTPVFRKRYNLLGDIIHSDPIYVGAPNSDFFDTGYPNFKSTYAPRKGRVYVGANDGMLHVFDAATGDEVYAYIPSMLFGKLKGLSDLAYQHQYYVDGGLFAGDMSYGSNQWRTVLVGSLGAGGIGLFALDITNEDFGTESSTTGTDKKVLWELDGTNADLGNIFDKVEIAKLPDGNWYTLTGNGYGSTNGLAKLLLIDQTGAITPMVTPSPAGIGGAPAPANGLSRPTLVDTNGDGSVDIAFAGDLLGNLYRFDLTDFNSVAVKIFSGGVDKPITTAPKIASHPSGGRIVLFATGSLLSATDVTDVSIQSVFAIRDKATPKLVTSTTLQQQVLSADTAVTNPTPGRPSAVRYIVAQTPPVSMDWTTKDGWQVDLPAGERVVLDPNLRAARFQVMSINPNTQDAWLIQLGYFDGATSTIIFDLRTPAGYGAEDTVNGTPDNNGNPTFGDIPVAFKLGNAIFSRQLIVRVSNGIDANYVNGLNIQPPPTLPPPSPPPSGGFALGHIDVDTDSPSGGTTSAFFAEQACYQNGDRVANVKVTKTGTIGTPSHVRRGITGDGFVGKTDGHQHEYDKAHGSTEVDFINLEPLCRQQRGDKTGTNDQDKLNRISQINGLTNNKEFFVIIANADLSPGSTFNLGVDSWNVVEYQYMIQKIIRDWKALPGGNLANFKAMMKSKGNPLIHTLDDLLLPTTQGRFSHEFSYTAIVDGALIPTITSCVRDQVQIDNGRYRNGSLTTQLISVTDFVNNPTLLFDQEPTDLALDFTVNGVTTPLFDPLDRLNSAKIYGGLHASYTSISGATNSAFLYESTLFWHFGDTYKDLFKNDPNLQVPDPKKPGKTKFLKPCYGTIDYALAKIIETAGFTQSEVQVLAGDLNSPIGTAVKAYQDAIAAGATPAEAERLRQAVADAIANAGPTGGTGGTPTTPTAGAGSTGAIPNQSGKGTETPQFKGLGADMGRRSWIDIQQ